MRIYLVDGSRIECWKIEPAVLKPGFILIDEEYTVDLSDVICIKGVS